MLGFNAIKTSLNTDITNRVKDMQCEKLIKTHNKYKCFKYNNVTVNDIVKKNKKNRRNPQKDVNLFRAYRFEFSV